MPRRAREDPVPFYDESETPASSTPETESITFTSFTISPSKRARTRYSRSRHNVLVAPTFAETTQASSTPLADDAPPIDTDTNDMGGGLDEGNTIYIEEDDVPSSRRNHVSPMKF